MAASVASVASRVLISLALLAAHGSAQNLCADINTSDSRPSADIFQSSGKCTSTCNGKFAYAVMQSSNCWCTNYTPDEATQKDDCTLPCPGYPFDMCGAKGRYSYVLVNADLIEGSKGSSSSSSSSSSASSTSTSDTASTSATADSTPTQAVSPHVTTVDGVARTVTVVPTVTGASGASSGGNDSGIKVPTLLGIIFGCIGGIAMVAMGIIWFMYRRKRDDHDSDAAASVSSPGRSGGTSRSSVDNLSNPFSDSRSHGLYSWRNRSGSLEYMPEKETRLRVANPDRT